MKIIKLKSSIFFILFFTKQIKVAMLVFVKKYKKVTKYQELLNEGWTEDEEERGKHGSVTILVKGEEKKFFSIKNDKTILKL